ncbi:MAG: hypothetical protein ABSF50_17880 [Burkholderiaceae bacterium]|jgi:hypothetical protein
MVRQFAIAASLVAMASCGDGGSATSSVPASTEVRLATNAWTVSVRGNATNPSDVESTLLRSADLAIANGYDFFVIVDRSGVTADAPDPAKADYVFREPGRSNTIVAFSTVSPGLTGPVYDARFTHDRLSAK